MLSAGRLFSKTPSLRWLWPSPTRAKPPQHRFAFSSAAAVKQVGTHNGSFHCDGALASFLLRLTNKFAGADIIRTRDLRVLYSLDAVVDVGGVNEQIRDRYDHHQQRFGEVLGHGFTTKLSSAGLVYKHYGIEMISKELRVDEGHPNVHWLFPALYKNLVEPIDAIDNGVNQYDIDQLPKYVNNTSLSSRVGRLNLDWVDIDQSSKKENEAFNRAMELAGGEFLSTLNLYAKSSLPARSIVMECNSAREKIDPLGQIIVLTKSSPWKLHVFELEEEMKTNPSIKYVIYQDDRNRTWRIQAVAV